MEALIRRWRRGGPEEGRLRRSSWATVDDDGMSSLLSLALQNMKISGKQPLPHIFKTSTLLGLLYTHL